MNEKTMFQFSYGLYVVMTKEGEKDNGCVINTAIQVTSEPNRIAVVINKANLTHDVLLRTKAFNLSILSEAADFALFQRFGFQSGRQADKLADFTAFKRKENGVAYLTEGSNGFISAWVQETVDLGTHTLFIGQVTDMDILSDVPTATYAYYRNNIKPAAKSYDAKEQKTIWRCEICNYEYEGENLPEGYVCPVCKHPASDFVKISGETS